MSTIVSLNGQSYFNERFGFGYPFVPDGALNAIEVDDGYVLNGRTGDMYNHYWAILGMIKLDFQGDVLWKKTWGDTVSQWWYSGRGSLIRYNSAYFTIGSRNTWYESGSHSETLLIKYNDDFDTIWTASYGKKQYPHDSSYIARSFIGIENGFAVVGTLEINYGADHEVYLLKMDSLGNVLWEHNYPSSEFRYMGMKVLQATDSGGYTFGAYRWLIGPYGAAIGDPIVIKTDSLGNKEWELNIGGQYQDGSALLCTSDDGNIMAASRYDTDSIHETLYLSKIQLAKIDNSGNIIWNYLYGDKHYYLNVRNIRPADNNGVIISGSLWHPSPNEMGFLLRVDSLGSELWYRQYSILNDQNSLNHLYDAIPTSDGGFLGAGGCLPVGSDTGTQDAWVIKVDSLGCTSPTDCWVGQEEVVWVKTETGNQIKIFPNPAQTWFTVEIGKNKEPDDEFIVEIFDLFGRLTKEVEIPNGQNNIRLYVSDWNRGMYLVRVKNRNSVLGSGKLVIK